jgi:hypothetical protein
MGPGFTEKLVADSLIEERVEQAERFRRARALGPARGEEEAYESVTVRRSSDRDKPALRRLAERDGRRLPPEPLLVAEVAGRLLAARSLANGASISDPFHPTGHMIELLALRSAHLRQDPPAPKRPLAALLIHRPRRRARA